jgi:hypothetical protein
VGIFNRNDRNETAALRDEVITLRTQVMLATSVLEELARKKREPRRDKQSVIEARKATTQQLKDFVAAERFRRIEPLAFAGMRAPKE